MTKGIHFYRMTLPGFSRTVKMILLERRLALVALLDGASGLESADRPFASGQVRFRIARQSTLILIRGWAEGPVRRSPTPGPGAFPYAGERSVENRGDSE